LARLEAEMGRDVPEELQVHAIKELGLIH